MMSTRSAVTRSWRARAMSHEPLTLLAAVASRVRRVDIGTAVLLPALRNLVLLARQVATLDQVAEGRLASGNRGGAAE
jgi:alkanesulfonate monooxygenase SsuD/methylene tetrahydromethanopterin reductase-like flavin-dependent oxidoreductase (luciferase family)